MDWEKALCPICGQQFIKDRMAEHLISLHHEKANSDLVKKWVSREYAFFMEENGIITNIMPMEKAVPVSDIPQNTHPKKEAKKLTKKKNLPPVLPQKTIVEVPKPADKLNKIRCKLCGAVTSPNKFEKHLARSHYSVYMEIVNEESKNVLKDEKPNKSSKTQEQSVKHKNSNQKYSSREQPKNGSLAPEGQEGNVADAFRQAFNEIRDGSKGLGHMRREGGGKFGSFPLHDDYNDESDSK